MSNVPTKIETRLVAALKKFQPILLSAKSRDVNESNTVMIVADLLSEMFGYDRYSEITSEFVIKTTFCDLAIKMQDKVHLLLEVKAIGMELRESGVKQAIDYGANQGVDWLVLTNGDLWKVFRVLYNKPIDQELICEFRITELNGRNDAHLEILYLITKEGILKRQLDDYHAQKQALSRYSLAAMILSEPILDSIRKILRRITPDMRVDNNQIQEVLIQDVIKRDVLDGEKMQEAQKRFNRTMNRLEKLKTPKANLDSTSVKPTEIPLENLEPSES